MTLPLQSLPELITLHWSLLPSLVPIARQTITESPRTPFISSDLATAGTARDIVIPGTAVPHSTFESTISAPPLSSTSPPTVFSLQHDGPNLLSPAESNLILDDVLPTVTAARASSGPTSAPDLSAAAEDDVNPKSSSLNGKDTLDPPSVNISIHANTMPTLDRPPSLPSVTDSDIAIAGPSLWEPNVKHIGDHPHPSPSHGRYDIV
ncbi:hypothetical protein EDB86DRAFT_3081042 [Lactarius hatsudake]|nr:hypothetical protein EDB86DRAFT_3081042 [Lactarius hatsudake]